MKIAIVGGGFSGLLTAFFLEKHKLNYTVFEQKRIWGKSFSHPSLILKKDYKKLPKDIKALYSKPLDVSKNFYAYWHGNVGQSIENKIINFLSPKKIKLFSHQDIFILKEKYDIVIDATGNSLTSRKLGIWRDYGKIYLKSGIFSYIGNSPKSFLRNFSKKGFVLNLPVINNQTGVLLLGVKDISPKALPFYWDLFIVKESLNVHFVEISDFTINLGFAHPQNFQNIFFVGSAALSSPKWYRNDYLAIITILNTLKSIT